MSQSSQLFCNEHKKQLFGSSSDFFQNIIISDKFVPCADDACAVTINHISIASVGPRSETLDTHQKKHDHHSTGVGEGGGATAVRVRSR